ncbi:MAG TPA: class I SAM-dependent methyltransferase [Ilumatobacteraceae bacterium]
MRSFAAIFTANDTDKQSRHNYGPVYDLLLGRHRTARRVLELGVDRGGSLRAWLEAFPDAAVCGVDNRPVDMETVQRVTVLEADAYDPEFVKTVPGGWDVIVDDGPHSLPSMRFVAAHYTPRLAPGGTLIIEDVPVASWLPKIAASVDRRFRSWAFGVERTFCAATDSRLFVVDLRG